MKARTVGAVTTVGAVALCIGALGCTTAAAQDLRTRIEAAPDGIVRLSYASKDGVCGNGRGNINTGRNHHGNFHDDGWESDCEEGPVRVAIDISAKRVYSIRTYVGGRWRPEPGEHRREPPDSAGGPFDLRLGAAGSRLAGLRSRPVVSSP